MLVIESAQISPRCRFRRHAHETYHVVAVLGGGFIEGGRKERRDVGTGMIRVSPPTRHDLDFGPDGARCLVIETDAEAVGRLDRSAFLPPDSWTATLLARIGAEDADEPVLELLAQVRRRLDGRRRLRPPSWLLTARALLGDEAGPAALSELAARVGVHRVHLAREFRDHFGMTVGECARRRRLERARALVANTDLPLSVAAADAGFADQAHLTRAFRAAFGTTPGRYRREHPLRAFKTAAARRS
jgi:AraC family transcriptional regulator